MRPVKKLVLSLSILVLLVLVAVILFLKKTQGPINMNTVAMVLTESIQKVELGSEEKAFVVARTESGWRLTSPIEDMADPNEVLQLIARLQNIRIESVVSENPDRYKQFGLGEGDGREVKIFVKDEITPRFHGFFGSLAQGYDTLFFRYEGKDPVHYAHGMPNYLLFKVANDYRDKELIFNPEDDVILSFQLSWGKNTVNVLQSSDTWKREGMEEEQDNWGQDFWFKMSAIKAVDFAGPDVEEKTTGLEEPYLWVSYDVLGMGRNFVVGNLVDPKAEENQQRYARADGREAILIVSDNDVQRLISHLTY